MDKQLRRLRQYGWGDKYKVEVPDGRNSRLDEIQAAILREKLPYLDKQNEERREIAKLYGQAFFDLPRQCPVADGENYVAHLYVILHEERSKFREFLAKNNVATDVHYPIPDHKQEAVGSNKQQTALPVTEKACDKVVSLPCFPGMTAIEIQHVIDTTRAYFKQGGI